MLGLAHAGTLTITPTTTLAAETGNNTSAASTYTTATDGNLGAGNVSKVATSTLLYSGSTSKIFAHFMPWFGNPKHISVGYNSNDPSQVHKQATDMVSRGIAGAIVDWYGPNQTVENQTTQYMRTEAETWGGQFSFAVMEDKGALSGCYYTSGCSVTNQLISDLTYAWDNFEQSPAYLHVNGRPVVFTFAVDAYPINWSSVVSAVPGNPILIFITLGTNGFTHVYSGGAFSWISINTTNPNDIGLSYLDNFYTQGLTYPNEITIGAGYKGFNDSLAPWSPSPPRVMNQNCGQTWMQSLAEAGKFYSASGTQLPFMQLVTWNDYEEGSEIETGIDNCVSISSTMSGSSLNWTVTGSEATVDHYTIFISSDGSNLMPLGNVPAGTHSFDTSTLGLATGSYIFFVKAVGKPSMANHMSAAVPFEVEPPQAPIAAVSVTPALGPVSLNVTASTASSTSPSGSPLTSTINFGDGSAPVASGTASHTYTTAGTYTLVATITDATGLSSIATSTVNVMQPQAPVAKLSVTPTSGTAPVTVTASSAASTSPDGSAITSTISFGDGSPVVAGPTASHTYNVVGTYTVMTKVTNAEGLFSSASVNVTVSPKPACPTTGTGVTICGPGNGATVTSPVFINAAAASSSTAPITSMAIYVDNVLATSVNGSMFNSPVPISTGSHTVVAQAWDSTGVVYKSALSLNVVPPVFQTGWWWNPNQGGRGFLLEQQNNDLYFAAYEYSSTGEATWTVSNGPMSGSTYTGALMNFADGQTLTGAFQPNTTTPSPGNVTIQFIDSTHATLTWPGGTIPIQRFAFTAGGLPATPGYAQNGGWWNANQPGRGFGIEIQNGTLCIIGYMYDSAGNPVWYLSMGAMTSSTLYQGQWTQYGNGQTMTGPYQPASVLNPNVGSISLQFTSPTTATLTLPNGTTVPLTRFSF